MTPQGQTFNQSIAEDLAKEEDLVFLCGHYEGVDALMFWDSAHRNGCDETACHAAMQMGRLACTDA